MAAAPSRFGHFRSMWTNEYRTRIRCDAGDGGKQSNVNLIFDTINTKRDATECLVYKCL